MKNSYYCITLLSKTDKKRLNDFTVFGKTKGNPHQLLHWRKSLDGTKLIIQGDIPDELLNHTKGKVYIEYIGDCLPNGQAEEKVHKWLDKNKKEWEQEEKL